MAKIRTVNGYPHFFCTACQCVHRLDTRWRYNYNADRPTFKPEIKLTVGPFPQGHALAGRTIQCESVINDGKIHYLATSTHDNKGLSGDLVDFDDLARIREAQEKKGCQ